MKYTVHGREFDWPEPLELGCYFDLSGCDEGYDPLDYRRSDASTLVYLANRLPIGPAITEAKNSLQKVQASISAIESFGADLLPPRCVSGCYCSAEFFSRMLDALEK